MPILSGRICQYTGQDDAEKSKGPLKYQIDWDSTGDVDHHWRQLTQESELQALKITRARAYSQTCCAGMTHADTHTDLAQTLAQ